VAEWIAYYLLDLYVTGSSPGGESFPTLIALNYSLTITEANYANRPFGVDKVATSRAYRSQRLFAYKPIHSTLGYNFKTVVNFQDEGNLKVVVSFSRVVQFRRNVPIICPRLQCLRAQ